MNLDDQKYLTRLVEKELQTKMEAFGAVCIEGPKWCGKTWTSLNASKSSVFIGDPKNNFSNRTRAEMSPDLVLDGKTPRLIDEWQIVPAIWDAVRHRVDQTQLKRQYLLTGSATPNKKGIEHSGIGRIGKLKMNTMSLFEMKKSSGLVSLSSIFNKGKIKTIDTGTVYLQDLIDQVVRGGWPANIDINLDAAKHVAIDYLKTVAELDIASVDGKNRSSKKVMMLLKSLGRNESTIAGKKTLAKDIREEEEETLSEPAISDYINALNKLFLLNDQPAFNPHMRSSVRVGKLAKHHFADYSLAVAALGATPEMLYNDLETFGFLFEAMCEHDLNIYAQCLGGKLFHYRDGLNREIDAVVELEDGRWGAFEIKLGSNQVDGAASSLLSLKKDMENDPKAIPPSVLCVICGLTNIAYTRKDGVMVFPITALKN